MKLTCKSLCLLFACCIFTALSAQDYIKQLNDPWKDDALVDLQYNSTNLRPEGLFMLGTGFNVLGFNENSGAVWTSKFIVAPGKTLKPMCIAQAGSQCFVFCQDASNVYFTSLNSVTGVIAYTRSFPRTDGNNYSQLSPVDADYDGSSTLHVLLSAKYIGNPAIANLVHLKIAVVGGIILGGKTFGNALWDLIPNDIEYVDATHVYASGSWRVHNPTTNPYRHMVMNLSPAYPLTIFDVTIPNTTPRSCYVKYISPNVYLVADSYNGAPAPGPLAVLRLTDNNNGTMTLNAQYLYGTPGPTFFIHDVQEEYGVLVASGEKPAATSAPRNFLFNTLVNTGMMSEYTLGGNVNIRTVYSGISLRLFSVAKEANTSLPMFDLRTNVNSTTTTLCPFGTLPLSIPLDPVTVARVDIPGKSLHESVPVVVNTVDSYKQYDSIPCNTPIVVHRAESSAAEAIACFPNPTEGMLHLQHTEGITHLRLYNASGQLLLHRALELGTTSTKIDLSPMPSGLYILETETSSSRIRTKIIRR